MRTDGFAKVCLVLGVAFVMLTVSCTIAMGRDEGIGTTGRLLPKTLMSYKESSMGLQDHKMEIGNLEMKPADINMDGNVDLISIGDHGSAAGADEVGIMVWFNDGNAKWTQYIDTSAGFGYGGIAYGDIDTDGKWDVVYAMHHNYDSKDIGDQLIEAALGDGTGKNWIAWDDGLATSGEVWGYFGTDLGDFNNDGYLDIVSNSFSGGQGLKVYKNNQNGNWSLAGNMGGWSHNKVMFADVNADGNLDVVAHKDAGKVYIGDGKGGWANKDSGLPSTYDGAKSADVNNDGFSDIALINFWDNDNKSAPEVYTWDDGTQSWMKSSSGLPDTSSPKNLQGFESNWFADMNNDGNMDLVSAGYYGIYIFTGDGTGKWTYATNISPDADSNSGNWDVRELKVGDFDHNGFHDIIVVMNSPATNSVNTPRVFLNDAPISQLGINLQYPRGGERFNPGSARFIDYTYSSPGGAGTIKLELSTTGNSGPWTPIVDNYKDGSRYQWIVPNTPSRNCYIKATITSGGTATGMNARPFEIIGSGGPAPVSIQVSAPNGGENWTVGTQRDIGWTISGGKAPFDVTLEYSITGASGPWKAITTKNGVATGPGTYSWTIPNDPSADAYVRASVKDASSQTSNDASNAKFAITASSLPPIALVKIDPSAPVTLDVGGKQLFTAKAYDEKGAELKSATLGWSTTGGIGTLSAPSGASSTLTASKAGSGEVNVMATYNGKSVTNSTKVTVNQPSTVPSLSAIVVTPLSVSGNTGAIFTLVAKATDTDGIDITGSVSFVWSIALSNLADLSQAGKSASVTLKTAGETTITVKGTYNGVTKQTTVPVKITKPQTEFPWWILYVIIFVMIAVVALMMLLGRRRKKQPTYEWGTPPNIYW